MTGYGKAEALLPSGKLTLEIRTLNGKSADINIKSSLLPKDKELEVRKLLANKLVRGTIDVFVSFEPAAGNGAPRRKRRRGSTRRMPRGLRGSSTSSTGA